jgi:hypothetical protein
MPVAGRVGFEPALGASRLEPANLKLSVVAESNASLGILRNRQNESAVSPHFVRCDF